MSVIRAFGPNQQRLSLSQVATSAELDRATTRRFLLTLSDLGYVRLVGNEFELTPLVLSIGYSYLSGLSLPDIARPYLQNLARELNETASLTILDGDDIVYLDLASGSRFSAVQIAVGTRFAAHRTSMGRVLLGGLSSQDRHDRIAGLVSSDPQWGRSVDDLMSEVERTAQRGWATADEELEEGLRGVAVPIRDRSSTVIAALNVSAHAARLTIDEMAVQYVPVMLKSARTIEAELAGRPS